MKNILFSLIVLSTAAFADPVDTFAHAVAKAEGFGIPRAIPTRCHNPGDMKALRGWQYPGQVGICKGGHVNFRNDAAGWAALHHQIQRILDGDSKHYTVDMTISQMGHRYAGFWSRWSKNVAKNLGVDKSTTLREYFDIPPTLHIAPDTKAINLIVNHGGHTDER
jgi:hypothetical protein